MFKAGPRMNGQQEVCMYFSESEINSGCGGPRMNVNFWSCCTFCFDRTGYFSSLNC